MDHDQVSWPISLSNVIFDDRERKLNWKNFTKLLTSRTAILTVIANTNSQVLVIGRREGDDFYGRVIDEENGQT